MQTRPKGKSEKMDKNWETNVRRPSRIEVRNKCDDWKNTYFLKKQRINKHISNFYLQSIVSSQIIYSIHWYSFLPIEMCDLQQSSSLKKAF